MSPTSTPGVAAEKAAVPAAVAAWEKPAPASVEDLRAIQNQLQKVLPAATDATVAVVMGGAVGSGVIVSKEGLILTAAHVIGKASEDVKIILHDGRTVDGVTLGLAPITDAGMIQITDEGNYPFVPLSQVSPLKTGTWCFALGHPEGPNRARGEVVRIGRVIFANDTVLWSDCKLLGGDSGGPLFDLQGRVIAIHIRIADRTELNYHVPIVAFQTRWDRLVAGELIQDGPGGGRVRLGVLTADDERGARVEQVFGESPALRAGVKVGDIITHIDAHPIKKAEELRGILSGKNIDDLVKLTLLRGDQKIDLQAQLAGPRMH